MKKLAMTLYGVAFITMMAFAQRVDSADNRNGSTGINNNATQDSALNQSIDPQSIKGTPRTQDPTSPNLQSVPQQQSQPQLQSQPQIQSQPQLQSQQPLQSQPELQPRPLQSQPQLPTQSQPTLGPNNPAQNQLNQPVQPTQPVQPAPTRID